MPAAANVASTTHRGPSYQALRVSSGYPTLPASVAGDAGAEVYGWNLLSLILTYSVTSRNLVQA